MGARTSRRPSPALLRRVPRYVAIVETPLSPAPAGARVTYDATMRLRGPLRALDAALVPVFLRVGRRAEAGLRRDLGSGR